MAKSKKPAKKANKKSKAAAPKKASRVAAKKNLTKSAAKVKSGAKKVAAKAKALPKVKAKAKAKVKAKAQPKVKAPAKVKEKSTVKPLGKAKTLQKEEPDVVEVVTEELPPEPTLTEEVVLTDAEGRKYCRVKDCDQLASVDSYCRYHYLLFWKKIQVRKKILTEGKLERYIEELTARYPDKFLDMLRKDLRSEKEFVSAIQELEIDESAGDGDFDDESESFLDEVRGMSEPSARGEEDF